MKRDMLINGFPVQAEYHDEDIRKVFIPLLRTLAAKQKQAGRRLIVFLAAPPAAGKSTLAVFLQTLAGDMDGMPAMQAAGMDGFHYRSDYLQSHTAERNGQTVTLKSIKGAPESFDTAALGSKLEKLKYSAVLWPFYDRRLHEPVADAVLLNAPIILLEGNYLLLDEAPWNTLRCDHSVFIRADEAMLKGRLISRKMMGGLDRKAAEDHYENVDGPNVRLCLAHSRQADQTIYLNGAGRYSL